MLLSEMHFSEKTRAHEGAHGANPQHFGANWLLPVVRKSTDNVSSLDHLKQALNKTDVPSCLHTSSIANEKTASS